MRRLRRIRVAGKPVAGISSGSLAACSTFFNDMGLAGMTILDTGKRVLAVCADYAPERAARKRLLANSVSARTTEVEMKMVVVRFVVLRSKDRRETGAGTLMYRIQEA